VFPRRSQTGLGRLNSAEAVLRSQACNQTICQQRRLDSSSGQRHIRLETSASPLGSKLPVARLTHGAFVNKVVDHHMMPITKR